MLQMEQKDYKFEIILILLKGKKHVREIAKVIGINHMMVFRKMKELLDSNVVNFTLEGRNKVYFIKKSPEARVFILMAEKYNLIKCLDSYPYLRDIVDKIQLDKKIRFALIFGSYAKGIATKKSDIDIFIETKNLEIKKKYSLLDSRLSIKIGKLGEDNLSKEIKKNHIIIKGGDKFYERFFD